MSVPTTNDFVTDTANYIDSFLEEKAVNGARLDPLFGDLLEAIQTLIKRGGKRLRPRLTLLSYMAFGGIDMAAIIPVAASQELFHAFLLMHDDIIDRDTTRWGGLNISGQYRKLLASKLSTDEARHFADATALLAGDLCNGFAQEMILGSSFKSEIILAACRQLQQTLSETMAGELIDMYLPATPWQSVSRERIMAVCKHKTSRYTFTTPLSIGALCAGVKPDQLALLESFGQELGIAFQLRDDMLGIFGDERILGKSVLSDLQEGKQTLLTYYAFRGANSGQKAQLLRWYGDTNTRYAELETVRNIFRATGADKKTEQAISTSVTKARKIFSSIKAGNSTSPALNELENIISHVADRTN
jgi:geranylgeranyl diphosphate synthase type I